MPLPIAISVPHAGQHIPPEAAFYCVLTPEQILEDGDKGSAECYALKSDVAEFVTTDVPRAIVDVNRPPEDRGADGVVKARTIWNEPIYHEPLPEDVIDALLERYYRPYHARLSALAKQDLLFAVDCHTMAAFAPPIGPDPDAPRPEVCLGDLHGRALPPEWTPILQGCFRDSFDGFQVTLNEPFAGGYITQTHSREMPWVQLEISRSGFLPADEIRARVLRALRAACERLAS